MNECNNKKDKGPGEKTPHHKACDECCQAVEHAAACKPYLIMASPALSWYACAFTLRHLCRDACIVKHAADLQSSFSQQTHTLVPCQHNCSHCNRKCNGMTVHTVSRSVTLPSDAAAINELLQVSAACALAAGLLC